MRHILRVICLLILARNDVLPLGCYTFLISVILSSFNNSKSLSWIYIKYHRTRRNTHVFKHIQRFRLTSNTYLPFLINVSLLWKTEQLDIFTSLFVVQDTYFLFSLSIVSICLHSKFLWLSQLFCVKCVFTWMIK